MSTVKVESLLDVIRARLALWLKSDDTHLRTTESWLRGAKFPAVGQGDDPCTWILRALHTDAENRPEMENRLAERLVLLLNSLPRLEVEPHRAELLYYNALSICQGIAAREDLFEALSALYQDHLKVKDRYKLTPLAANSLRDALIENQTDNRLRDVWLAMSESTLPEQDKDPILRGNGEIALHAVRLMPPGPPGDRRQGKPATVEIAIVLRNIAESQPDDAARRKSLSRLMSQVIKTYPNYNGFAYELFQQADKLGWSRSVIESYPAELCVPTPTPESYLVWKHHLTCLPATVQRVSLCEGVMFQVNIAQQDKSVLEPLIEQIEAHRIGSPFSSEKAMTEIVRQALFAVSSDGKFSQEQRKTAIEAQGKMDDEQARLCKVAV